MARRVRTSWRKMKKTRPWLYHIKAESRGMTATRTLNRLKKKKVKPMLSLGQLRLMASRASKRSNVPVKVTRDMTEGHRLADGIAIMDSSGKIHVRIHPVLQYNDKRYARDVIEHELDHAKVDKRIVRNFKKREKARHGS